jgi:hypothetical protein
LAYMNASFFSGSSIQEESKEIWILGNIDIIVYINIWIDWMNTTK